MSLSLCDLRCGLLDLTLELRNLAVRLFERCLKRLRINLEQQLSFFYERAFRVILSQQIAGHLRLDLCVDGSVCRSDPLAVYGHVSLLDLRYLHIDWSRGLRRIV